MDGEADLVSRLEQQREAIDAVVVEQQLLDPTLRKLLDRWQGDDIRGHLEKILDSFSLQGMEEEAIKQELKF